METPQGIGECITGLEEKLERLQEAQRHGISPEQARELAEVHEKLRKMYAGRLIS